MQEQKSTRPPIVAAIALDGNDAPLINAARYLAKKLHAPLELVHAVRPLFSYVGAGDIVLNPYYGYELEFSEKEEKNAQQKLISLAASLDDASVRTHVIRDFPPEAVMTCAQEKHAGLIVCGVQAQADDRKRFFAGHSTGYTLASDADVPVLLIPVSQPPDFQAPLRVLIADNLENEGEKALEIAMAMANALHVEELVHIHVQPMNHADVDRMIASVRESMILGQRPSDTDISREFYLERVVSRTREELIRRCHRNRLEPLNINCAHYEPVVAFGNPADQVHEELLRRGCRLMVFGRHHLIRKKTLSLGRIPYHAMIEQGAATLVVPDTSTQGPSIFTMDRPKTRGKES